MYQWTWYLLNCTFGDRTTLSLIPYSKRTLPLCSIYNYEAFNISVPDYKLVSCTTETPFKSKYCSRMNMFLIVFCLHICFNKNSLCSVNIAAMVHPPSHSYATTLFGVYELKKFPELKRLGVLLDYNIYLDDICGVHSLNTTQRLHKYQRGSFQSNMNPFHCLEWEVS